MIASSVQQIALLGCAGLLLWAAASDIIDFRIPNRVSLAIVALYPVYLLAVWLGGVPINILSPLLAGCAVFAVGFTLFASGLIGGGDVKLLSAVALWAGSLPDLVPLLLIVGAAGGVLSLVIITAKATAYMRQPASRPVDVPIWRALLQQPAPYGVAIAVGGLFTLGHLAGFRLAL